MKHFEQISRRGIALVLVLVSCGIGSALAAQQLPAPKPAGQAAPARPAQPVSAPVPAVSTGAEPIDPTELSDADDRRVAKTLRAAYAQIDTLSDVQVAVDTGVVTLRGQVERPSARDNAEAIAKRLAGVLFVNNKLEVVEEAASATGPSGPSAQDEAIQERLSTIFSHVNELQGVDVDVESGVVHLGGEVPSPDAVKRAGELAGGLEGVAYVDNELRETRDFSRRIQPALDKLSALADASIIYFPLAVLALIVMALFWLLSRLVTRVDFLYGRLEDRPLVQNIVRQVVSTLIFLAGVVAVLEIFDITSLVGALLGTAGVAGIALGFAFRDIGENYLSSVALSLRRPFAQNDYVRIADYEGKVVRLTTRDTVLMTLDGNHVRVPNALVFKSVIYNYTRNPRQRFAISAGVDVGEDLVEVRRIGIEALAAMEGVLGEPPPFARVEQLGDSNVQVTFFGWVDQKSYDFLNVQSEATYVVKAALDAAGVQMPEPIYRVNLHNLDQPQPARVAQPVSTADQAQPAKPAPPEVVNLEAEAEIDDQIDEDRRTSDEADLLDQ